ncbi:T9SS type A sorting domain-containing protein [Wenyingzhuangia sp. IMCC45533]
MKKRISIFVVLVISLLVFVNYFKKDNAKESYVALIKNHPIQERLKLSKKERKKLGIPPNRYFDEQYLLEINPNTGKTHPENILEVKNHRKKSSIKFSKVPGQNAEMAWVERGPDNIAGRTRVVFYDPTDITGKRVYAGGVSGGLWMNNDVTDEDSVWSQVGVDENLSISCFAIDPNDSNIWYIGTGEAYTGDDGVGNGIWITQNGGTTWSQLLSVNLEQDESLRPYVVTQILAWDNAGTTEVYFSLDGKFDIDPVAFSSLGWWKVNESSFDKISFLTPEGVPYVFSDVEIAADNSLWFGTKQNIFGRGGGKIFRSTNGVNFMEKYSFTNGGRVELAVSKINANTIYALASTNNSSNVELIKTTDGNNFVSIAKPNDIDTDIDANDFARDQGFYNLTLEVDPTDDAILYAGGINLFRSSNSGASWSQISKWSNSNNLPNLDISLVHPDQHAVAFNILDSNKGVFANDGGIYYCANLANAPNLENIVERNKNYNITQFYSAAISQDKNSEFLLGGAQDNGSLLSFEATNGVNSFVDIFGGDGFQTFIDKDNEYLIVSFVGNFYASYPIPFSSPSDQIAIVSDENSGDFANTADLDDNLDILYTNGTVGNFVRISRYTDLRGEPERKNFSDSKLFERPTAIKVSPFTTASSTVFVGTEGASVLKVTHLNTDTPTWENIDLSNEINAGSISDIDFGNNEDEIIVTLHNYGVNNIYYTENGGVTWVSKEGNFPDIPVKAVIMNPDEKEEVIIGTNMGVWSTSNFTSESPNWQQSFNGMSNVRVTKFDLRTSDNTVVASTYGRGLFTGTFTSNTLSTNEKELNNSIFITNKGSRIVFNNLEQNEDLKVNIYNISGKLLYKKNIKVTSASFNLSTGLSMGVYVVKAIYKNESINKKIVITDN